MAAQDSKSTKTEAIRLSKGLSLELVECHLWHILLIFVKMSPRSDPDSGGRRTRRSGSFRFSGLVVHNAIDYYNCMFQLLQLLITKRGIFNPHPHPSNDGGFLSFSLRFGQFFPLHIGGYVIKGIQV